MSPSKYPPGQHEIKEIMRWNVDHPGILHQNPKFDPDEWKLIVDGEVENPVIMKWKDVLDIPSQTVVNDFHCVEGWTVKNCAWTGFSFDEVIERVKPKKDAKFVLLSCADGFTASLTISDIKQKGVILAYKLNEEPLLESLGAPLRLIVPDKYAYKNAMWILRISFLKTQELGYWEKRGYSHTADVWKNDRFT
ncbi:MAG: molybdopterin-dependent oxidoreductase [Candidatus Ranarchaeia archaeon]|jgi:DMSO/TMAO reductase YedYZ molybdopterin-dependent catalytic subunit